MDADVLVVGAGPTGLMLANQLARRGVSVMIVEAHAGPARETRALGVQARTLEIEAHLGIVSRALELGTPALGARMWAGGRRRAHVRLDDVGRSLTPYPYVLILGQDDTDRLLGDRLRAQGVEVRWNCELIGLSQEPEGVVARLRDSGATTREVRVSWVAGCDGAHST